MIIYAINLVTILATGVWASLWFIYNTEWFPVIGGALGLGSFLAWIAFILGLLTDEKKKTLQRLVDEKVFSNRHFLWAVLVINALLLILLPSVNGGLHIINASSAGSITLKIHKAAPSGDPLSIPNPPLFIAPHDQQKMIFPVKFWGSDYYNISASDAPDFETTVKSFTRKTLIFPDVAWQQNLLLIKPSSEQEFANFNNDSSEYYLKISLCGKDFNSCNIRYDGYTAHTSYSGGALLMGTEKNVRLPNALLQNWRSLGWPADLVAHWSRPTSLSNGFFLDHDHRSLKIAVLDSEGVTEYECRFELNKEINTLSNVELGQC
ncbi:MAG: hypothetical protein V7750_18250 [Sneathiella sp.]